MPAAIEESITVVPAIAQRAFRSACCCIELGGEVAVVSMAARLRYYNGASWRCSAAVDAGYSAKCRVLQSRAHRQAPAALSAVSSACVEVSGRRSRALVIQALAPAIAVDGIAANSVFYNDNRRNHVA